MSISLPDISIITTVLFDYHELWYAFPVSTKLSFDFSDIVL